MLGSCLLQVMGSWLKYSEKYYGSNGPSYTWPPEERDVTGVRKQAEVNRALRRMLLSANQVMTRLSVTNLVPRLRDTEEGDTMQTTVDWSPHRTEWQKYNIFAHIFIVLFKISLLFYFFSSLRRGDLSTVFCIVSFDFNWSRSPKIRFPLHIGLSLWSCRYLKRRESLGTRLVHDSRHVSGSPARPRENSHW